MIEREELKEMPGRYGGTLGSLRGASRLNREFVAFQGPSGSGKTTLLNMVGLLDVPPQAVPIRRENVSAGTHKQKGQVPRSTWGYLSDSQSHPELNVYENVEIPLLIMGEKPATSEKESRADSGRSGFGESHQASPWRTVGRGKCSGWPSPGR